MARPNLITCLVMSLLFLATASATSIGKIIYVNANTTGANNGTSWFDAFHYLQDALVITQPGDEIRVAQGIYTPDRGGSNWPGDRQATFQLINEVTISGGYAGFDETDPNTRDITAYETILTGDLHSDDTKMADPCNLLAESRRFDNSYHIVTGSGTDSTSVLDGFTITAGNASGGYMKEHGGGMYIEGGCPTISHCTFRENSAQEGGGMYNHNSSPILTNCTFINNQAEWYGGGMANYYGSCPALNNCAFIENNTVVWGSGGIHNDNSNPTLTNCTFSGNYVGAWGGGIGNYISNPVLTGCRFSDNTAGHGGGGISNGRESSPILTNCTFNRNLGGQGGAMRNNNQSSAILTNCIFAGNSAEYYGGGMHNTNQSEPILTNCTFSGNSSPNGNALSCNSLNQRYPSNLRLTNCILWDGGNEIWNNDNSVITITYSDVEGGQPGEGNINIDPYFAEPENGDLHLKSQAGRWDPNKQSWVQDDVTSPCIDAADISSPIGFEPFPNGGRVNMGAYGGSAQASKSYFSSPVAQ